MIGSARRTVNDWFVVRLYGVLKMMYLKTRPEDGVLS
jgi:hypothetical protein